MKSDSRIALDPGRLPKHLAIIMDGNGRWAKKHRFARIRGHRAGADTVRNVVTRCREVGIPFLTLYAFSEENWSRPKSEIALLMKLLDEFLRSERDLLTKNQIRLRAIGNISKLPEGVRETLFETMTLTKDFTAMNLILALSYGGRDELVRAFRKLGRLVQNGDIAPEEINSELVSRHLDTADFPDVDLLLRTSGEMRTSNFLPWQSIYAELMVSKSLWPDFSPEELDHCLYEYTKRERRFGKTGEQVRKQAEAQG